MATTDQPQEPVAGPTAETIPAHDTTPLPPPVPPTGPPAAGPPGPPAPAASGGNSHVGLVVGSIIGGVLLLALAFGGGMVAGWTAGSLHAGRVSAEQHWWPGNGGPGSEQGDRGRDQRGPGQRDRQDRQDQPERNAPDRDLRTPEPSPTS